MKKKADQIKAFDLTLIQKMREWGIWLLGKCLGIVFLWFGLLKIMNVSPVTDMIEKTYPFLPYPTSIIILGVIEAIIGLGLILKVYLRFILVLLWLQMAGVFLSLLLKPSLFFNGNPFYLTLEGEFIVKNIVIIAASIVIGGHRILPFKKGGSLQD